MTWSAEPFWTSWPSLLRGEPEPARCQQVGDLLEHVRGLGLDVRRVGGADARDQRLGAPGGGVGRDLGAGLLRACSRLRAVLSDATTVDPALSLPASCCSMVSAMTPAVRSRSSSIACASWVSCWPTSASCELREYELAALDRVRDPQPAEDEAEHARHHEQRHQPGRDRPVGGEVRRGRSGRGGGGAGVSGRALAWSPARIAGMSVWLARRRPVAGASGPLIALPSHIHVVAAGKST